VLLAVFTDERLEILEEALVTAVELKLEVPEMLLVIKVELDDMPGSVLEAPLEVVLLGTTAICDDDGIGDMLDAILLDKLKEVLTEGESVDDDALDDKLIKLPLVIELIELDELVWLVETTLFEVAPVLELAPTVKVVDESCVEVDVAPKVVELVASELA
jgi:hypothetical protein